MWLPAGCAISLHSMWLTRWDHFGRIRLAVGEYEGHVGGFRVATSFKRAVNFVIAQQNARSFVWLVAGARAG
jgi:hypothetical protein